MQRHPPLDGVSSKLTGVSFHSCYTSFSSVLWCFLFDFLCALDHSSNAFVLAQVFCHPKNNCPCYMVAEQWRRGSMNQRVGRLPSTKLSGEVNQFNDDKQKFKDETEFERL